MKYSQSNRPLQVDTPLPNETLLITGFRGSEELSALFSFQLDLIAENSAAIDFSKLIGNDITVSLATLGEAGTTDWRYINGICARFAQGNRNEHAILLGSRRQKGCKQLLLAVGRHSLGWKGMG